MCCVSASKVNTIQKAVKYQYGKVEISMSVFMDEIAAVGTADNIRKGIQNCRGMEIEKKMDYRYIWIMIYGLKKTKYMVINTGKELKQTEETYLQVSRNGNQQMRKLEKSYTRFK